MGFQVPAGETPTAPAPAGALVNPPWSASPTQAELTAGAPVSREGGRAIMDCVFTAEGTLSACAVASQVPAAGGFGDAALAMAPRYRVAAIGADGIAVVGRPVRLAVIFPRNAGRR